MLNDEREIAVTLTEREIYHIHRAIHLEYVKYRKLVESGELSADYIDNMQTFSIIFDKLGRNLY